MIGRVAAANAVPEAQCSPDLLKKLGDEGEDKPEPTKLSTQQRQELLLATLEKDGGLDRLKDWPPELARRAKALLLEFHHVFSLEPNEIGCTDATKHVIELMKDEPFKERFRHIAPPLVDVESMVGARHFSCMDLKSGFWQVQMAEESRQYTAFTVGSMGVYEFLRMPYGLCNAPATFQHLMQNCLGS